MKNEILVVDDNFDIRNLISNILKDKNFVVREAANFDQASFEIESYIDCPSGPGKGGNSSPGSSFFKRRQFTNLAILHLIKIKHLTCCV